MKTIFLVVLIIGSLPICNSQVQKLSGIYTEYKRTLWNDEDGSNYTFDGKPFKLSLQFDFNEDANTATICDASNQSEQVYIIKNDTLVFERKIGKGENVRTIYTKYIIIESQNELIIREFKGSLDDNYYLKKYYFKKNNELNKDYLKKNDYEIYTTVEEMPSYPGGMEEMKKNITTEVNKSSLKGEEKVFLKLLINPSGKIESLDIQNNPKAEYAKEAVKIIRKLPDFTPGKQKGKSVYVFYNLPIKFARE